MKGSESSRPRLTGWLRAQWQSIFLSVDENTAFPETVDELRAKLSTDNPDLAAEVLAEAEDAHGRLRDRVDGAERRATTLQGATAIAASLTLTAAGLLVDRSKLHGWGWQLAFGVAVIYATFALAMCAWRATLATSRVHRWVVPANRDILDRVGQGIASARIERAVALLHVIGGNERFARYKVAMLRAATEWLVRALIALLALALLAGGYALLGSPGPAASAAAARLGHRGEHRAARSCALRPPRREPASSPTPPRGACRVALAGGRACRRAESRGRWPRRARLGPCVVSSACPSCGDGW
jgi:hypothetical protein